MTTLAIKKEFTEKVNIVNKVAGVMLNLLRRIEHIQYKSILVITNDLYLFTKADTWSFDNLLKLLIQVIKYTQEGNSCILDFYSTIQSENIY